eukprot:TRINITY_DN12177_c0_g1_i1.p2 TRINITY_DN12177_c0_g1~~TRINITY_DN12177_c0_g1_i1.p2  ORF type:complete len:346 (+),score=29.15 TRINITY_DN12177_c0_g1_i1:2683-3720(+)
MALPPPPSYDDVATLEPLTPSAPPSDLNTRMIQPAPAPLMQSRFPAHATILELELSHENGVEAVNIDTLPSTSDTNARPPPPAYDDLTCCSGIKRDKHLLCLFLTIINWALIACYVIIPDFHKNISLAAFILLAAMPYALYLYECYKSSTAAYIKEKHTDNEVDAMIQKSRSSPPLFKLTIQNYHMEKRKTTRTVSNGRGGRRTETETTTYRQNTHYAESVFPIRQWRDDCPRFEPPSYDVTKMHFKPDFTFEDAALKRFKQFKAHFLSVNIQDVSYDFNFVETVDCPQYQERVLCLREGASVPCSARRGVYWFLSLLTLSWFARAHLSATTGHFDFPMSKTIIN